MNISTYFEKHYTLYLTLLCVTLYNVYIGGAYMTQQELLDNYAKSYSEGGEEFGDNQSMWPNKFDDSPLDDG